MKEFWGRGSRGRATNNRVASIKKGDMSYAHISYNDRESRVYEQAINKYTGLYRCNAEERPGERAEKSKRGRAS